MKIVSALLVLFSLHLVMPAHADWDEAGEKREQAARQKAAAEEKAQQRKVYADNIREEMKREGIDTRGMTDEQVIQQREAQAKQLSDEMHQTRAKGMNDMRKSLGKEANGKTDEEVAELYAAKQRKEAAGVQQQIEANRPALEAGTKSMTGKSMDEIMNMSDEELDKLANEMEKKYGQ